jgi:hypothetical protein
MTLSNVSLHLSASNDHCTPQSLFLWLFSWQYCNVLVHQPKALRTLDMYQVVTLTSKTGNSLSTKACEVNSLLWRSHISMHLLWKSFNFLGNLLLSRRVAGARTPVLLCRFTSLKIDCLVIVTLCLWCSSLWICTADKPFFEYSIIKCRVDINNLLTLPVAIFIYKQCLCISVTWSGEACVRSFVSCIVRSFVSCIVRSYFVSCVRLIKLTNETSDTRNERYTKRTIHEANEPNTRTKRKRMENEKRTNDTRKRNERKTHTIRNIC